MWQPDDKDEEITMKKKLLRSALITIIAFLSILGVLYLTTTIASHGLTGMFRGMHEDIRFAFGSISDDEEVFVIELENKK